MSSPKAAVAKRRPKAAAASPALAPGASAGGAISGDALRLAAEIERALAEGRADALSNEALQAVMAALCRSYAATVESDPEALPLKARSAVSSTDIMLMASALLRSANLAVFELGMWQSWTGR